MKVNPNMIVLWPRDLLSLVLTIAVIRSQTEALVRRGFQTLLPPIHFPKLSKRLLSFKLSSFYVNPSPRISEIA